MSRSFHQRHKKYKNTKCPNSILSEEIIDGKKILKFRKIKTKPYGRKDFIGYGEEEYSKKYGEYFATQTNKTSYRMKEKQNIKKIIEEIEGI